MVLHWNGSRWLRVARRHNAELKDVVALSPTDVWAVGDDGEEKFLAMHWNGSHWRAYEMQPPPGHDLPAVLWAVSATARDDVWAVGYAHIAELNGYDADPIVRHWDGKAWKAVPPPPAEASLNAVATGASTQPWVAGVNSFPFATEGGSGSFVGERTSARWLIKALPRRLVEGMATDVTGTVWAVGLTGSGTDEQNGFPVNTTPLIERYSC